MPPDITTLTTRHLSASKIQDYQKKYKEKRQLKKDFEEYDRSITDEARLLTPHAAIPPEVIYEPIKPRLASLVERASKILKKEDYETDFWKTVMENILIGLHEYQNSYDRGRNDRNNENKKNYRRCEKAFKVLLRNLMDYKKTDYLNDADLYDRLQANTGDYKDNYLQDANG